jgi:hypothetical protein
MTILVKSNQGPVEVTLSLDNRDIVIRISGPPDLPPVPQDILDLVGSLTAGSVAVTGEAWVIRTTLQ